MMSTVPNLTESDSNQDLCAHCDGECVTDSICCDNCHMWNHRKCAKLSIKVFNKLAKSNKPLYCKTCKGTFYCKKCTKYCRVNQKSVKCNICNISLDKKCTSLTDKQYENIKTQNDQHFCMFCIQENLPFGDSPDTQELIPLTTSSDSCILCVECNTECNDCDTCPDPHRICESCNNCVYHDYGSLSQKMHTKPVGGLGLIHFNVRSITKHFPELHDLITNLPKESDIICISESKLKDPVPGQNTDANGDIPQHNAAIDINIPNYNFICTNSPTNAGGTGIYILKSLQCKARPDMEPAMEGCECSFTEITTG